MRCSFVGQLYGYESSHANVSDGSSSVTQGGTAKDRSSS